MKSSAPFDIKLRFIGDLFDRITSSGLEAHSRGIKRHVIESIRTAKENVGPIECLQMTFRVAAEAPLIFCSKGDDAFTRRVSELLCSSNECLAVLREPDVLRELIAEETQPNAMALQTFLTTQMQETLTIECLDVDNASRLFLATSVEESPPRTHLASFGVHIFATCFLKWKPMNINDLIAFSPDSLQLIHGCFAAASQNESMAPEDSRKMKQCREHIQNIEITRLRHWQNQNLSIFVMVTIMTPGSR